MANTREPEMAQEDIGILDLAAVIVRRWRVVLATVAAALAAAIALLLLRPDVYTARTVLVPSANESNSSVQLLASQLPAGLVGLSGGGNSSEELIGAVLRSRTLADSIVSRMGVVPYAGTREERDLREVLDDNTDVNSNTDGSFEVEVTDIDPDRAALIANQIPAVTNVLLSRVVSHAAEQKQAFLAGQVASALDQLEETQRRLVQFQRTEDAPELQEQARQTLEAAATLQRQITEQEVMLAQLRRTSTPDNPQLRAAEAELSAWRGQLARLTGPRGASGQIFLPLQEGPELRAEAARILREYEAREQIYLSLAASLAEAQLDARNNLPVVSVLDAAIVPRDPSGMPGWLLLAIAITLGGIVGICLAFVREYFSTARHDPQQQGFFVAWEGFRSDLVGSLPFLRRADVQNVPGNGTPETLTGSGKPKRGPV